MAGYSHRSLVDKLGIAAEHRVQIAYEPRDVDLMSLLEPLPAGVQVLRRAGTKPVDVALCFVESYKDATARLPRSQPLITKSGAIWAIWPKKSSQRFKDGPRDVSEDVIRNQALELGLVDVKVCAIDETWSGLKLVWRLVNR